MGMSFQNFLFARESDQDVCGQVHLGKAWASQDFHRSLRRGGKGPLGALIRILLWPVLNLPLFGAVLCSQTDFQVISSG